MTALAFPAKEKVSVRKSFRRIRGFRAISVSEPCSPFHVSTMTPLETLECRLQRIRDRVVGVAYRYQTACYLVGRPGTGKTFTVLQELEKRDILHVYFNARMSPMGLFDVLAEFSEHVVVLDDIASLFKSDQAVNILMAATDGDPKQPRLIRHKTKDKDHRCLFTGSIFAISNLPLRNDPLAKAFTSRAVMLEHEPTDEELQHFILDLARRGNDGLTPDQCLAVARFLIDESRSIDVRLDLRHWKKALSDFRQDADGLTGCDWRELVRTSLQRNTVEPVSRSARVSSDRERVRIALERFPNDLRRQLEFTGLKKTVFYRRKSEL
jgi:hypothetical protein